MVRLTRLSIVGFGVLFLLVQTNSVLAATAPPLGTAESFAVLGGSTVTNTGPTVITGDLGLSPGTAVVGFPPGIVVPPGTIHAADAVALGAQNDVTTAYNAIGSGPQPCPPGNNLTGQDLGGMTLTPGVYCFDSSAQLTGILTLDGTNADVWIFQIGSTLTTASGASVVFSGGATNGCGVFWQVGTSATFGTNTSFNGNIIALSSITLNNGATIVSGRAWARNGATTLDTNAVDASACVAAAAPGGVGLFKVFSPSTIPAAGVSTLTITLTNTDPGLATLLSDFTDPFPAGLVIAPMPNAHTTCGGGDANLQPTPDEGDTSITLITGSTIPGGSISNPGFCTITVDVTAQNAGSYLNSVDVGALHTDRGDNTVVPAAVILTVSSSPVPTLNEWGMIIFMGLAGLGSVYYLRRRRV